MTKTNEQHAAVKDEPKDRFASDLETLKSSFAQLRSDVTRLFDNTLGAGKSGAGMLKDRSVESGEKLEQRIAEKPLLSAAIALGIGFVLAKLLTTKR